MTDRYMIDIETLGTDPGCAIVSIGVVEFSISDGPVDGLFLSVDVESCQARGLEIDANTLAWWLGQSAAAREQLTGGDDLEVALAELTAFVGGADEIWANSPAFDCAILRAAFEAVGIECPWRYYQERDYRTCRETLPTWPDREQESVAHNAVDDARFQAECLAAALEEVVV